MSLENILEKPQYRRSFFVILGLTLVVLALLRRYVVGSYDAAAATWTSLLTALVNGLMTSVIVTVGIGWTLFRLTPEVMRRAEVQVIAPGEISALLERALRSTTMWWYRGNCGRYFRSVALPEMARIARQQNRSAEVYAVLIDPTDAVVCERYAKYRGGLKSALPGPAWTKARVQKEALATVIAILATKDAEPLLRIHLGLMRVFSSFRLDLSSECVLVTKESKQAPAVRCDQGSFFYDSYKDEIVLAYGQARQIHSDDSWAPLRDLDTVRVRELLGRAEIRVEDMDDAALSEALELARNSKDPYA